MTDEILEKCTIIHCSDLLGNIESQVCASHRHADPRRIRIRGRITIVVTTVEGHDLSNSSVELLCKILVNTVGEVERCNMADTRNTLGNLEESVGGKLLMDRRNSHLAILVDRLDRHVQLVQSDLLNGVTCNGSVVMRTTFETSSRGILLDQETGCAVWVADLGRNAESEIGKHVLGIDHPVVTSDITGATVELLCNGEDSVFGSGGIGGGGSVERRLITCSPACMRNGGSSGCEARKSVFQR